MSIRIMTRVWDARGLPSSGMRLVLLKLADCANDAGERAFPSVQTIADDCELDRSTVQRALRWLAAQGYIKQTEPATHHRPAAWAICLDSDGCRYERVTEVEGPQNAASEPAAEGPRLQAPGAASTALRGRIHASADYVPGTTIDPSVPVPPTGAALGPVAVANDGFERFWSAYPRRVGKAAALVVWRRLRPDANLQARILTALAEQRQSEQWLKDGGQFIPHPRTWLMQGRWDDEPVAVPVMNESTTKTLSAGARWLAKQKEVSS